MCLEVGLHRNLQNTGCVSGETEISVSRDFSKSLCSKKKRAMTVQVSCLLSCVALGAGRTLSEGIDSGLKSEKGAAEAEGGAQSPKEATEEAGVLPVMRVSDFQPQFSNLSQSAFPAPQKPPCVSGKQRPGFCPEVPKDSPGICLNGCSGDDSCPKGMKCCSNGCGYICKKPVFKVSTNQPRAGQGCQQHPSGLCWNRGLLTCPLHMGIWKTPRKRGWKHGRTAGCII